MTKKKSWVPVISDNIPFEQIVEAAEALIRASRLHFEYYKREKGAGVWWQETAKSWRSQKPTRESLNASNQSSS
jgi:hypothetical protein